MVEYEDFPVLWTADFFREVAAAETHVGESDDCRWVLVGVDALGASVTENFEGASAILGGNVGNVISQAVREWGQEIF